MTVSKLDYLDHWKNEKSVKFSEEGSNLTKKGVKFSEKSVQNKKNEVFKGTFYACTLCTCTAPLWCVSSILIVDFV